MNIIAAFKYVMCGYRIRRASWAPLDWIDLPHVIYYRISSNDILADDWEIITDGIIKDFPITYQE